MTKKEEVLRVPNLRFLGFEGEWDTRKLGDVCEIKTGNKDTQNKVEDGQYPFFVRSNTIERINTYSYDGEAILTSGDGVGVGKNFHYINGKFDFHQRVYSLRAFKSGYDGKCIYYLFSSKFYDRVIRLSAKNSVDSVRMDMISGMKIYFPEIIEQQKISSFLSLIDEKILTQSKIIQRLETLMQNLRERIFSQKIRFKDCSGLSFSDWTTIKLGDIANRIVSKNKENNKNVLTISAQHGLISQLDFFNKSVSAKDLTGYFLLSKNHFAFNKSYSNGYPMGAVKRLTRYDKGVVSTLYICFDFNDNVNLDFMEHYFEAGIQNPELEKIAQEGARNHGLLNISLTDFFNIKLTIPSLEEQNVIGKFLSKFQRRIEIEKQLLLKYETQKKHLLQNLFI